MTSADIRQEDRLSKVETYRFAVEPFHVDFTGRLFMGVLGNHLLNAAGHHSHNRGWGIDHLNERHYTWVLSRLCIELSEMPAQYEHVEVETWVESVMKLFTERNFLIRSADDGRVYGYARSIWAMIDVETRHPADLLALKDGDILRYVLPDEEKPCPIAKYGRYAPPPAEPATDVFKGAEAVVPTRYSDVDINGHINSIKYIEHILDLFPRRQYEQQRIRRFEIAYKTESYFGDDLHLSCRDVAGAYHVEIRKHVGSTEKPAGETVVQAKVFWQ